MHLIAMSDILRCVKQKRVRMTIHVKKRMDERDIDTDDLLHVLENGDILEQYPNDKPFPSCLVKGMTREGREIHVVCSLTPEGILVLITTY